MTTEAKTYDTKFNAQRGAQRSGLKPSEFEVTSAERPSAGTP